MIRLISSPQENCPFLLFHRIHCMSEVQLQQKMLPSQLSSWRSPFGVFTLRTTFVPFKVKKKKKKFAKNTKCSLTQGFLRADTLELDRNNTESLWSHLPFTQAITAWPHIQVPWTEGRRGEQTHLWTASAALACEPWSNRGQNSGQPEWNPEVLRPTAI